LLPLPRVGDGFLECLRWPPLACRPHRALGADLVDVPVDLQVVAVRIGELDGDLASRSPPSLVVEGDAVLPQPRPRAEHLVDGADLEREVVEAAALTLRSAAEERHAVMGGLPAHA